jgi:hypothetical protein
MIPSVKEGIMAITALGSSSGIAKQFRQRVPVRNSRRSKKVGAFEPTLNQQVRALASSFDLRA